MTTLQEEQEEEREDHKDKDLVSSKVRVLSLTLRKTTVPHTKQKRLKRRAVHNLSAPHPVSPDPNPVLQKILENQELVLEKQDLALPFIKLLVKDYFKPPSPSNASRGSNKPFRDRLLKFYGLKPKDGKVRRDLSSCLMRTTSIDILMQVTCMVLGIPSRFICAGHLLAQRHKVG
jgi:hypothetical protein